MQFIQKASTIAVILFSIFTFSSCEVFVDFGLKSSTFELYESNIAGDDLNLLVLVLPGYVENDPDYRYIVKYLDNDKCTGDYYAADTLQYSVEGTWTLIESDVMRLQLDAFVDGEFKITKLDKTTYLLETDANRHGIELLDNPTLPLKLFSKKLH